MTPLLQMTESDVSRITSRIWLGSIHATYDEAWLRTTGITHVVTALEVPHTTPAMRAVGCKQLYIPIYDHPHEPIEIWFQDIYDFIQNALESSSLHQIYIHCMAGISRSSTLLASYLICRHRLSTDEAITFIRGARYCVNPNPGFYSSLKLWELHTNRAVARAAAVKELKETAPTE